MKCEMWMEIGLAAAIAIGACALVADVGGCAGAAPPTAVNPAYVAGLVGCVADVKLAKEAMRASDAGIDRAALHARFEACAHNVEEVFGPDAGAASKKEP